MKLRQNEIVKLQIIREDKPPRLRFCQSQPKNTNIETVNLSKLENKSDEKDNMGETKLFSDVSKYDLCVRVRCNGSTLLTGLHF